MDGLYILDKDFAILMTVDIYESVIWTDRYQKCGDFEICTSPTLGLSMDDKNNAEFMQNFNLVNSVYYLSNDGSEHTMFIESVQTLTDSETGNKIIVSGTSLENVLSRRVLWDATTLTGNLQNGIESLINTCIINPSNPKRKIENFIFIKSEDPRISELTVEMKIERGDNLYDVICKICEVSSLGFKIVLNELNQLCFSLYIGEDRTYDQIVNPAVTFSPSFDNIINGDSLESKTDYKNAALVTGEAKTLSVFDAEEEPGGLLRRELYVDARDISRDEAGSDQRYTEQLIQRGNEGLVEHKMIRSFDGQADTSSLYVYGRDFFMGDILQVENEYGMNSKSRVTEMIISDDESGFSVYPTFTTII